MAETDLRVVLEWDDGGGVRAKELQATWCRLEIAVGERLVTLLRDRRTGSFRQSIHVSAYPLAEWVAYHWWALQAAVAKPGAASPGLSLRSVGDGFPWPRLSFAPDGDSTLLVWERSVDDRVAFVEDGSARVDMQSFVRTAAAVVENTLSRLDDAGVPRTALHDEWQAVHALDDEERGFALAAARLGIDPYDVSEPVAQALVSASQELTPDLLDDVLTAAEPSGLRDLVTWVTGTVPGPGSTTAAAVGDLDRWRAGVTSSIRRAPGPAPWARGFAAAQSVRPDLEPHPSSPVGLDDVVETLPRPFPHRSIDAVGNEADVVRLVVPEGRSGRGLRFSQARALYRALTTGRDRPFALTSARTGVQQAERAFAAELLAPITGIRDRVPGPLTAVTDDDVDRLADAFEVSALVIRHQIDNHAGRVAA
ncbi:MAG: ImmA/IrrE family metallo-endopeptidase [Kineosporiaceae bacterium]